MKFPIGFALEESENIRVEELPQQELTSVKSLVQVFFPDREQSLAYFNDRFDLNQGDYVITYISRTWGGVTQYAKKACIYGKNVINFADSCDKVAGKV